MPYKDPEKQRAAQAKWYREKQKATVADRSRAARARRRKWFNGLKEGKACPDCLRDYPPCVMEYHHVNGDDKLMSPTDALACWSKQRILDEIAKCVLLCSNCHKIRHMLMKQDMV